jgi:hypothetical protein
MPRDEVERVIPTPASGEPEITKADDDAVRGAVGERLRMERLRLERECELLRAKIMRLSSGTQWRSGPAGVAAGSELAGKPARGRPLGWAGASKNLDR